MAASSSEKTLLADGLIVSPLDSPESIGSSQRSLRDLIADIDNKKDFENDVLSFSNKVPHRSNDIKYIPHSVCIVMVGLRGSWLTAASLL